MQTIQNHQYYHEKYIGDVISADCTNNKNIDKKVEVRYGQTSSIMSILREVSLGQFYFQMAVLLRQTIFLSSILLNAESWVGHSALPNKMSPN